MLKEMFPGKLFRKIFPVKILISGYKHNYFGARWLTTGKWLSLHLRPELSNTLAAWRWSTLGKQEIASINRMLPFSSWTPSRSVICIEEYDLDDDLHGDCCAGIHEHMWAQHRNTWDKDLRERRQHDIALLTLGCPHWYAYTGDARGLKCNLKEGRNFCLFGSLLIQ